MSERKEIKAAVIDMNNGAPNQGMRGILEILTCYRNKHCKGLRWDVFDARKKGELPGLDYDLYISSGGPGSPYDDEGAQWENGFFALLDGIEQHNRKIDDNAPGTANLHKKYALLICHSFQLACRKYNIGEVTKRRSNAFGIFPVHLTPEGQQDVIFDGLDGVFYSVDSRDWQVIQPNTGHISDIGASVLALEKERPQVELERCMMSVRFTKEIAGTQFHPEADPVGMKMYLLKEDKKQAIIAEHGQEKYDDMLNSLDNPERIMLTQRVVLPNFLNQALGTLQEA